MVLEKKLKDFDNALQRLNESLEKQRHIENKKNIVSLETPPYNVLSLH